MSYNYIIRSVYKSRSKWEMFIRSNLGGFVSERSLLEYFNCKIIEFRDDGEILCVDFKKGAEKRRLYGIRNFLQYSNIDVLNVSYSYNSLQYFLCRRDGELVYLSGNELLDIAVDSVKDKIDCEEATTCQEEV